MTLHYDHHSPHAAHPHGHSHHSNAPTDFGSAFFIGILLNTSFIIAEIIYGLTANSLALLADAGHNASDVVGLFMAWGATALAKHKPTPRYTYGLQSSTIIVALTNAVILLLVTGGIGWESIQRLTKPEDVAGITVMTVAVLGVAINGLSAWLFVKGSQDDLNIKGAFLHLLGDAAISLGVVVSGFIILKTSWHWIDPAVSIAVSLAIIYGTWGLLRDSLNLALHAVPAPIAYAKVKSFLADRNGVKAVHDLHIWALSTTEVALSAHLLMNNNHPGDSFLKQLSHELREHFHIGHATIQIELGDDQAECALAPDHIV